MAADLPAVIRTATRADVPVAADLLGSAFQDDPVTKWILPDDAQRAARLRKVYAMQLNSFFLAQDATELVTENGEVRGVSLWSPPGRWRMSRWTQVRQLPQVVFLAGRSLPRLMAMSSTIERHHPDRPHW